MKSRELLLKAIQGEVTPRPAWVPFLGVHGGKLLGLKAPEYLRSSLNIYRAIKEAYLLYHPDGLPITFDLQLEAEILGCELRWADEVPPTVASHPLAKKNLADLPTFDTTRGRFPIVIEALRAVKQDLGKEIGIYGLITGPFTLAAHLLGSNLFLEMYDNQEKVKAVLAFCVTVAKKCAAAYLDNGADVIAVVDPLTSQISPNHFDRYVTPYVNEIFDYVHKRNALSSLFVCGDATRNLAKMCETHCNNISIDENIPLEMARDLSLNKKKSFGGNLKLTSVLLLGNTDDAKLEAIRCMETGGAKGFVLAPGCDLPYAVPPSNLEAIAQLVHDPYQRQVAKATLKQKTADTFDDIKLPDYERAPRVLVDVITLDSTSCAPCQYMLDATQKAAARFGDKVTIRERSIKTREGLAIMSKLGIGTIPALAVDGDVLFVSLIPDQPTLVDALARKLKNKNL